MPVERRAVIAVLIAVVLWSGTSLFVRAGHSDALVFTTWRLWFALPPLFAVVAWRSRRTDSAPFWPEDVPTLRWLMLLIGAGAFFIAGAATTFAALGKGAELIAGDTVFTHSGRAQLRFTDGAFVSLQPNSEFRIDEYRFEGKAAVKLAQEASGCTTRMVWVSVSFTRQPSGNRRWKLAISRMRRTAGVALTIFTTPLAPTFSRKSRSMPRAELSM